MKRAARILPFLFLSTGLFLSVPLVDCGDTCVVITGIFPETTSAGTPPTCKLGNATGTVSVNIDRAAASSAAPIAPNLQHVFVTLRGVEAHPNAVASEDSPDWQELAPELPQQPVQIDLMASPAVGASSCAPGLIRKSRLRADAYRQIRLRLVSDQPAANEPVPQHNECVEIGFNCVVTTRGQKRALAFENGARDLHISSDRIPNGFFNVLPDTDATLTIRFEPFSSLAAPAGEAVHLAPVFSVHSSASCDSDSRLR